MDEINFFGLSLGTISNIIVGIGTIILAYFTYRSVRASENQVELTRRNFEKPRVLENIQNVINTIHDDLERELDAIRKKDISWVASNERGNYYISPLVFPISTLKNFYLDFKNSFSGPEFRNNISLFPKIVTIHNNLQKRYGMYKRIDQIFYNFIQQIEDSQFEIRRKQFLDTLKDISLKCEESTSDIIYGIYKNGERMGEISEFNLDNIFKSLIISSIIKPLEKDEFRLGCLGFSMITEDLYLKMPSMLEKEPIPDSEELKKSIDDIIQSLKSIDEKNLPILDEIKSIYRDSYTLTETEINPFRGL